MKMTAWLMLALFVAVMAFPVADARDASGWLAQAKPAATKYAAGWNETTFGAAQGPFMSNCKRTCQASLQSHPSLKDKTAQLNMTGYCSAYCTCSLQNVSKQVPYMDFSAFGLGKASPATRQTIDGIINSCAQKHMNVLTGGSP